MFLIWVRDNPAADLASAKTTFSSWDACMSKTYCKWPVIAAIIIGSLIIISIVFCVVRCICCGAECVCCCLSCCKGCCPSSSHTKGSGYQQAPSPVPKSYPSNRQYQSPMPPSYNSGPFYDHTARTATFDAPSKTAIVHDDALPAMPSWSDARVRHVEEEAAHEPQHDEEPDAVELDRFDTSHPAQYAHDSAGDNYADDSPYQSHDQYGYHEHDYYGTGQITHDQGFANENAHYSSQYDGPHTMPYSTQHDEPHAIPYSPRAAYPDYDNRCPPVSPQASYSDYNRTRASPGPHVESPYQFNDHLPSVPAPARSPVPAYGYVEPQRVLRQSPPPPLAGPIPMPSTHAYTQTSSPPSYSTRTPSILSPGGYVTRKPTQDSWRNV